MIDPMPKLLIELREDAAVDAIVSGRVRGAEPAPGDDQPVGKYKAFVVLVRLASPPHPRVPIQFPRILARCYGRTRQEAYAVYAACSTAIHMAGPRLFNNGLGIYVTHDETGASQDTDPDTQQPLETFVITGVATTVPVGVGS